ATLPLTCRAILHWDGMGALEQDAWRQRPSEHGNRLVFQDEGHPAPERQALPVMSRPLYLIPAPPPYPIDCDKATACLTFYLDLRLHLATVHGLHCGATGVLMWVRREEDVHGLTPAVHPVMRVNTAYEAPQADHIELVPHLPARDPLLHHIALVLR